ncbi:MAG TPA: SLBB domain-containing protein [Vicinamibacteria bacterium]
MFTAFALSLLLAPQAPPPATSPPATAPPAAAPADSRPAGITGQDYRIGAGDVLRVTVYGHEDLTQTVVVQPNGSFVFPLIGAVAAARSTPAEVEAKITGLLAKGLIRDPKVTVVVQEYRSQVVFVVGEVTRPGSYPLAGGTTVVEILARAGPLSPNAGSDVVVVRPRGPVDRPVLPAQVGATGKTVTKGPGPPPAEVIKVDMRAIRAGQLDQNLLLQPNDTVFVPEAMRFFVSGEVRNPGSFAFSNGLTVRQAVSLAGGFSEDASTKSPRIVRQILGRPKELKVKLDDPIQPGDTVVIKARLF